MALKSLYKVRLYDEHGAFFAIVKVHAEFFQLAGAVAIEKSRIATCSRIPLRGNIV